MDTILTSIDKIREYNKAFKTLNDSSVLPYVFDAETKYLKKYLGSTLYPALVAYVKNGASGDDDYDALLPYAEMASSRFTLFVASPFLDINLGDTGFTTSSNQNFVPASANRVSKFDNNLLALAYENIEQMLIFLEENQDNYPLWVNSDAYTYATSNFIRTAIEFDGLVPITVSRLLFYHLKPIMDYIEKFNVETIISSDLASEIRQQIVDDNVSDANQKLLDNIRPAIAYLAISDVGIAKAGAKETSFTLALGDAERLAFAKKGQYHIMEIQKMLDENPDDYPLFTASDLYNEDKTSNDMYEIQEDDKVLGFGAIPM